MLTSLVLQEDKHEYGRRISVSNWNNLTYGGSELLGVLWQEQVHGMWRLNSVHSLLS